MTRRGENQAGLALVAVLAVVFVLTVLSALVLYLSGKEVGLSALRARGAEAMTIAEGGAYAARSALMAVMNAGAATATVRVDVSLNGPVLETLWAGGRPGDQNPLRILGFFIVDGRRLDVPATSSTRWAVFPVDWGLANPHLKLRDPQTGSGAPPADPQRVASPPANPLGTGSYRATVLLLPVEEESRRRRDGKWTCSGEEDPPGGPCFVHQLNPEPGQEEYEFFFEYRVFSDGQAASRFRRRVNLAGRFSVIVRRENFAKYALFTHAHTMPGGDGGPLGAAIWFTSRTTFDGPVHTNGSGTANEFRFAFFPKFTDQVTSVSPCALYNNTGSNLRLCTPGTYENVDALGRRIDAPLKPDGTPADDQDNPPADFQRGVDPVVVIPSLTFNQKAIAIGHDPMDMAGPNGWGQAEWNRQIRRVIPELDDGDADVPRGVYIPVRDVDGNRRSDPDEPLAGAVLVQGELDSLTLETVGSGSPGCTAPDGCALYRFVQGGRTVTVIVDRAAQRTTVTDTAWPSPQTRAFTGVPKGYQLDPNPSNVMLVYVEGDIRALSGTLEEKEQATVVTGCYPRQRPCPYGRIDITGHLRYERPPDPADPDSNPLNVLGLFSANHDIRIPERTPGGARVPDDLVIHAVLMAGEPGVDDGHNSAVFVQNYSTRPVQGQVHLLGGIIEEYYGAFGTFDARTGAPRSGYGRDFRYDRRMARGFSPPYFPTASLFRVDANNLAGVKPTWREGAP